MRRKPASYIPEMQNWITEARGNRGGIISRVEEMKQGREEGSFARPCDSLHTQARWNNSRFPWSTAGIEVETKGERGKQVHFLIFVQLCAVALKPASCSCGSDNRDTFIKKMSFHSILSCWWTMWSPSSFRLNHVEFPPSLRLILYGFSRCISLVL